MKKKILALFLSSILLMNSLPSSVFASEKDSITILGSEASIPYVELESGERIDTDDLMHFDTVEEMEAYFSEIIEDSSSSPILFSTRSTDRTVKVDSIRYPTYRLTLFLSYGTSRSGNRGYIKYHHPYTQMSGFAPGIEWEERNIFSEIKHKKDIYVQSNGTMNITSVIAGNVTLKRTPVQLSGIVNAVR